MNSRQTRALLAFAQLGFEPEGDRLVSGPASKPTRLKHRNGTTYRVFSFTLFEGGRRHVLSIDVHRLVAYRKFGELVFRPGTVVRHLDGDSLNNHPSNIELGTHGDNMRDRPPELRLRIARAAAAKRRKLNPDVVREIRRRAAGGESKTQIAVELGLALSNVYQIVNRKFYADVPDA